MSFAVKRIARRPYWLVNEAAVVITAAAAAAVAAAFMLRCTLCIGDQRALVGQGEERREDDCRKRKGEHTGPLARRLRASRGAAWAQRRGLHWSFFSVPL